MTRISAVAILLLSALFGYAIALAPCYSSNCVPRNIAACAAGYQEKLTEGCPIIGYPAGGRRSFCCDPTRCSFNTTACVPVGCTSGCSLCAAGQVIQTPLGLQPCSLTCGGFTMNGARAYCCNP